MYNNSNRRSARNSGNGTNYGGYNTSSNAQPSFVATPQSQARQYQTTQQLAQQLKFKTTQVVQDPATSKPNLKPASVVPEAEPNPIEEPVTQLKVEVSEVEEDGKKKFKKGDRLPNAVRRQRLNCRLSKMLTPKSALMILHEFRPGCSYNVQEQVGAAHSMFLATIEHENRVLATGQGHSKAVAKNHAAENAIKALVSEVMSKQSANPETKPDVDGDVPMEVEPKPPGEGGSEEKEEKGVESEDPLHKLPWAGLASFAMYKLFSEWHNQGAEVPMAHVINPPKRLGAQSKVPRAPVVRKELPPNARELHPSLLLNTMRPGLVSVEVGRTQGPRGGTVTIGFEVENQMFTGTASNKKEARKEAAKAVLTAFYGINYPTN